MTLALLRPGAPQPPAAQSPRSDRTAPAAIDLTAPAALVFDLDGTLVDSGRDIASAVNLTRRDLGLPELPVAAVVALIGEGARVLMQRALPVDWDDRSVDGALRILLSHYERTCTETTVAYPGIPELLESLAGRLPLALLTNKPERMTAKILDRLSLGRFFRLVIGGDTLPTRKPDPAALHHLAHQLDVPVSALLLVGDSRVDAETARAAGARLALAGWGYGGSEVRETGGEFVAASVAELARSLETVLGPGILRGSDD